MDYPRQLKIKLATEMANVDVENDISSFNEAGYIVFLLLKWQM